MSVVSPCAGPLPKATDPMKKSASVWQFVQHRRGSTESWIWRRMRTNGRVEEESSAPQPDFGKSVSDALAHGFQPLHEYWTTRSGAWITHFPPRRTPYEVPLDASPAAGARKRPVPRRQAVLPGLQRPGTRRAAPRRRGSAPPR